MAFGSWQVEWLSSCFDPLGHSIDLRCSGRLSKGQEYPVVLSQTGIILNQDYPTLVSEWRG